MYRVIDLLWSYFRVKADIVHTTRPFFKFFVREPFILTIHGNFKKESPHSRILYPHAIKRADIITVPSQFLKTELGLAEALVIPNALDVRDFDVAGLVDKTDNFNILSVANFRFLEKSKGLVDLIEILSETVKELNIKINHNILGTGRFLSLVKRESRQFQSENLTLSFLGFQDSKKYLGEADLFCHFSYLDNLPMALIEAMASGLPVLTNKIGAVGELIEHGRDGLIAASRQDYHFNLKNLLFDFELRKNLGSLARRKIEQNFDWQVILPKWFEVYKSLL